MIVLDKNLWVKSSCWRLTSPEQSLLCIPVLRLFGRRNLISLWASWFIEELSAPKLLLKRHRLACSPVHTKLEPTSPRSMLRLQASWVTLDAWLLTLCGTQRYHSQTLRPKHSVCWRQDQRRKFSYRNKMKIRFRDSSGPFNKRCFSLDASELLLQSLGIFWNVSDFPFIFLTILDTRKTINFFFCASLAIFWHGPFDGFLIYNLRSYWWRPSNLVPPIEQSFCSADVRLLWNLSFLKASA